MFLFPFLFFIFYFSTLILMLEATIVIPIYRHPTRRSSSFLTHYPSPQSNRLQPHLGRHRSERRGKMTTTAGSSPLPDPDRRRRNSREQQTDTRRHSLRVIHHPKYGGSRRRDWCSLKRRKPLFWFDCFGFDLGSAGERRLRSQSVGLFTVFIGSPLWYDIFC